MKLMGHSSGVVGVVCARVVGMGRVEPWGSRDSCLKAVCREMTTIRLGTRP